MKAIFASLTLFCSSAVLTQAAIVVNLPTPTTDGSIQITQDITFTINPVPGAIPLSAYRILLDEWVTNDGTFDTINATPGVTHILNAGTPTPQTVVQLTDNEPAFHDATPNDGFLSFDQYVPVVNGDQLTIKAGTFTIPMANYQANFNTQGNQTFTGNVFLVNTNSDRLSNIVNLAAVPEPSRAFLLMGGLGTLLFRRRKS